jgi:hypothetical protein
MSINGPNDGFSMLVTKEMTRYVDFLEHVTIRDRPLLEKTNY